jgi:hypothetical protein
MTDSERIKHWLCVLRGAERQLDAARLRSDVDYAARRLMNAKRELAQLGVDWRAHLLVEVERS